MFHHVIMLKLREPLTQQDHGEIIQECVKLQDLPGLLSLEFVHNHSVRSPDYTHAFVSSFVDEAAHELYQQTPLHIPLKEKVRQLAEGFVVLDYET